MVQLTHCVTCTFATKCFTLKLEKLIMNCDIKCEHPVIIFNHDIIYLLTTKRCTATFLGQSLKFTYSLQEFNFPWQQLYAWKSQANYDNYKFGSIYDVDGVVYPLFLLVPCGKCKLCKAKKKYDWETRCMCESATSKYPPLFITLTYDALSRPDNMSTVLYDFQCFMKRLRINVARKLNKPESELRYLAVSEWTPKNHFPHIHMMLWNMPFVHLNDDKKSFWQLVEFIQTDCWQHGICRVERARDSSGRYCMKYMSKSEDTDCWRLASRRPGIGHAFCMGLRPLMISNTDITSFKVADGKGKLVTRSLPSYFRRLLYPSLSLLFPAKIIRAIKDFREIATNMSYFYGELGYTQHLKSLQVIYSEIANKFYQLHINWNDGKPCQDFIHDTLWYKSYEDVKSHPLLVDLTDECTMLPFYKLYHKDSKFYKPVMTTESSEKRAIHFRQSVIMHHNNLSSLWHYLDNYIFDDEKVQLYLDLKDLRSQSLLLLSKDFKQYDIDNELNLCKIDEEWVETHWTNNSLLDSVLQ